MHSGISPSPFLNKPTNPWDSCDPHVTSCRAGLMESSQSTGTLSFNYMLGHCVLASNDASIMAAIIRNDSPNSRE